jgi:multidrug efflux pump subunit AcrB
MGIVRFALRFPYTFYVLAVLILFLGVTAITVTPTDIFPQINIPVVSVTWQYTGLSAPEMEQRVTTYSQYSMSSSVNGISVQKIYFQPDVNLDLEAGERVILSPPVNLVDGGKVKPSAHAAGPAA